MVPAIWDDRSKETVPGGVKFGSNGLHEAGRSNLGQVCEGRDALQIHSCILLVSPQQGSAQMLTQDFVSIVQLLGGSLEIFLGTLKDFLCLLKSTEIAGWPWIACNKEQKFQNLAQSLVIVLRTSACCGYCSCARIGNMITKNMYPSSLS